MPKSSYPKTIEERAKLYLHCMVEIKERLRLVEGACAADTAPLFKNEICSLQFRHICELIAIACLAAQGDFKTQRAFREAYSPALIFNALREIFPFFFPQPSTVTYTPAEGSNPARHHVAANTKGDAYGEQDIIKLWGRAGNDLHRASVDKYLKATFGKPPTLEPIAKHVLGLVRLLETHLIPIGTPETSLLLDVRLVGDEEENVVANFLTLDRNKSTISLATYRSKLVGR